MAIQPLASAASAPSSRPPSPVANWSEDQLARLEFERRRLLRTFAFHPHVRVTPLEGDPPGEYDVEFRTRTLCVAESGELELIDSAAVRVWLPPSFPHSPPQVRPLRGLFHPNFSYQGVHLSDEGWQAGDTIAEFLRKLGELLAWRAYDPESVVNDMALQWLEANPEHLPLDGAADFTADVGGTPLERIARHGAAALDRLVQAFNDYRARLLSDAAPNRSEIREFARQAERKLELFHEPDVPGDLRARAAELERWARDLPVSAPIWEALRSQWANTAQLRATAATLAARQGPLAGNLDEVAALGPATPPTDLKTALAAIPPAKVLDLLRLKLPREVREIEELLQALRVQSGQLLEEPIECPVADDTPLGRQVRTEIETSAARAAQARDAAHEAAAAIDPYLDRARAESAAVARLAAWREFLDLHASGHELVARLADLGAAGIHAFFIENSAGTFGPFQLDEAVDLGTSRVAVRSTGRNRVRLIEVPTIRLLGRSDTGTLVLKLNAAEGDPEELTTFRLTERWDDLAVRLDFLFRQTTALSERLSAGAAASQSAPLPSWTAQVLRVLAEPAAMGRVRDQHDVAAHRWQALLLDLQALGPVKARIETWNLVQRLLEVVPLVKRRLSDSRAALAACERDLGIILSRSTRDLETNRLIVPPMLSAGYSEAVALRRRSTDEIAKLEKFLKQLGAQLSGQFAGEALVGTSDVPAFAALPPFPDSLAATIAAMTDAQLEADVSELEIALNLPVRGQTWKSAQSARTQRSPAFTGEEPVEDGVVDAEGEIGDAVEEPTDAAEPTTQPLPKT